MNEFEIIIRDVVKVAEAYKAKNGTVLTELMESIVSISNAGAIIGKMTKEQKVDAIDVALDNLIGDEPNALIGPTGKVKLDVPWVGTEVTSDIVRKAVLAQVRKKLAETPTA